MFTTNNSEYEIFINDDNFIACYHVNRTGDHFQNTNALTTSLPTFVLQLSIVLIFNRLLLLLLKPLKQPPVVAYIISGVLIGPTALGRTTIVLEIFPIKTLMVLETFANLALVYYMFLVGLEMDVVPITNSGNNVLKIAISGVLLPLGTGFGLFFLLHDKSKGNDIRGCIFWAVALTATSFPDLTRILTDLKLLRTNIGTLALSASVISDFCTWLLLVLSLSMLNTHSYYTILCTVVFIVVCLFVFRPIIAKLISHAMKGGHDLKEQHIWFILGWIVLFGFITDACGVHSIVGGFMFGVIMPRTESIRSRITEKLEDFISGILMPLFFLTTGLRTDISFSLGQIHWYVSVLVIVFSFAAKIVSTMIVFIFCNMPMEEGMAVGVLMNTKGVLSLIIINTGRNIKALNNITFPLMALSLLVMTCLVEPIIAATYKPQKRLMKNKHRTIASAVTPNTQFRILACIHSIRDVPCMISLLNASHATPDFPITTIAVQLVELTGRSTAMLIVHDQCKTDNTNPERTKSESQQIIDAFKSYERRNNSVFVQTITAVSAYKTMHEDICSLAEDKHVCLIILPFYKDMTADDRIEESASTFPSMNQSVLENAPCSVGLLVDRGLGSIAQMESTGNSIKGYNIAVIFVGGPDDREALAYAWRMAGHAHVSLTVLRFLPGKESTGSNGHRQNTSSDQHGEMFNEMSCEDKEKMLDDEYTYEFMFKTMGDKSITYAEKVVNNGDETLAAIKEREADYDLYIVGRGKNVSCPLTAGLSDWSSCKELGILGDALASSNFASHASVLVVQQYIAKNQNNTKELEMRADSTAPWNPLIDSSKSLDNTNTLHQQ